MTRRQDFCLCKNWLNGLYQAVNMLFRFAPKHYSKSCLRLKWAISCKKILIRNIFEGHFRSICTQATRLLSGTVQYGAKVFGLSGGYWKIKPFPIRHFPERMACWDSFPHILYSSTLSNASSHMWEDKLERGGTMSACSLGGVAFLPVVLGILSKLMESRMLKSTDRF